MHTLFIIYSFEIYFCYINYVMVFSMFDSITVSISSFQTDNLSHCCHITPYHHHYKELFESSEHIKAYQAYSVKCVFTVRPPILTIILQVIYGTNFICDYCENICDSSCYNRQIKNMIY